MAKLKTYMVKCWTYDFTTVEASNKDEAIELARECGCNGGLDSIEEYVEEEAIELKD